MGFSGCYSDGSWYSYFKENMTDLGLPVPDKAFTSAQVAFAQLAAVAKALETYGPGTTVAELVGAGLLSEVFMVAGAASASGYVGAMVGSAIIATQRYADCGRTISDYVWIMFEARVHDAGTDEVAHVLAAYPEIYDQTATNRRRVGLRLIGSDRSRVSNR